MEILAFAVLAIFSLAGFFLIFLNLFGTLMILAGAVLFSWMTGFSILSIPVLAGLAALYLLGEMLDFLFTVVGAKKFGASNRAVLGAVVGGFIGSILGASFFGVGVFPGLLFGIFLGAFAVECMLRRDFGASFKAGLGGVVGVLGSVVVKAIIAFGMIGLVVYRLWTFYASSAASL